MFAFHPNLPSGTDPLRKLRDADIFWAVKYLVCACGLLALSACSKGTFPRTPQSRTVDEIEAKLSKVPCIGSMSRWERHYSFASKPFLGGLFGWRTRWYDYNKVAIRYRQAGFEEFKARRIFHHGDEPLGIDDREYDVAFGHYELPTRTAFMWACGPNMSDQLPVDVNIVVR